MVLRTTVRRVVLDVVVTDSKGLPVRGLRPEDFAVTEDGEPQRVLSMDANGFSGGMDYVPEKLPPQPPNTFLNLPVTPERGPLYVLLYDLVNMDQENRGGFTEDHSTQMIARQQMMKFIQSKPEGARFAIFVRSDGVHLIQGFTSDKHLLFQAIDPHHPKPHLPTIFLMGTNYGQGDRISAMNTLHTIVTFLDGLPGRKNLIWFSAKFPLSLFAGENDGRNFREESKATLDLLAANQVAVYPVDAEGVSATDSKGALNDSQHSDATSTAGQGSGGSASVANNSASNAAQSVLGESQIVANDEVMDQIAQETGGRAFYGTNDLSGELVAATDDGSAFYTLTYSPTNTTYDGHLRNVHVELARKGLTVAYRRFYYGSEAPATPAASSATSPANDPEHAEATAQPAERPAGDALAANMQHGAPEAHALVFVVQAHRAGTPRSGTPEQMAALATEPAYFRTRRHSASAKPLPSIPLEKHTFTFEIPRRQFNGEPRLKLEVATAVFDADGRMMNAVVGVGGTAPGETPSGVATDSQAPRFYRIEQELEVPVGAATARFAVRDTANDRTGAMEINLPLAP